MNPVVEINNQRFELLPDKAMYWIEFNALVLSDLHLGKATHFRKNGIGVPANLHQKDLDRLKDLIAAKNPSYILIVGDIFHSDINSEWNIFMNFISDFPVIRFILIRGNHDTIPAYKMKAPNITVLHKFFEGGIEFIHEPSEKSSHFQISGHIHPGVVLKGKAKQAMKLPCFLFTNTGAILPAFGGFTGTARINVAAGDRVFVIAGNEVIEY